jgi:uncharacterized delta-60 repeat protein
MRKEETSKAAHRPVTVTDHGLLVWSRGVTAVLIVLFTLLGSMPVLIAETGGPGSLDTSFNGTGQMSSSFTIGPTGAPFGKAPDIVIDQQGRIVLGTSTKDLLGRTFASTFESFLVARYNSNGTSLDLAFGDGLSDPGTVITDFGQTAGIQAVGLDSAGRIVAVGTTGSSDFDFAITRYTSQGIEDFTFDGGRKRVDFGSDFDSVRSVAIDSSGRIIAAGTSLQGFFVFEDFDFALVRLLPNGTIDQGFGDNGRVLTDFGEWDEIRSVLIDDSGRIIAVGYSFQTSSTRIAIARYTSDGRLDSSFGHNGRVLASFGLPHDYVREAILDSAGRLLVAGGTSNILGADRFIALARFTEDGSLDGSFGSGGVTLVDIQGNEHGVSLALDSAGRIIVAGIASRRAFDNWVAVTRYTPDGALDMTFGLAGIVLTDVIVDGTVVRSYRGSDVEVDSQDRILVAGRANPAHPTGVAERVALIRYIGGNTTLANTAQLVDRLWTNGAITNEGVAVALTEQLDAAQELTAIGQFEAANGVLGAFVYLVNAQRGKHIATTATIDDITFDPAAVLISHAESLYQ